jgi:hypothetical protein
MYQTNVCDISEIKIHNSQKVHLKCIQYDYSKFYGNDNKSYEAILPKGDYCIYSQWHKNSGISFTDWIDILLSIMVNRNINDLRKNKDFLLPLFDTKTERGYSDDILSELGRTIVIPYVATEDYTTSIECLMVSTGISLGVLDNYFFERAINENEYVYSLSHTGNANNWKSHINRLILQASQAKSWNQCMVYFDIDGDNLDSIDSHVNNIITAMSYSPDISYIDIIKNGIQVLDQIIFLGLNLFVGGDDDEDGLTIFMFSPDWSSLAIETANTMQKSGIYVHHNLDSDVRIK